MYVTPRYIDRKEIEASGHRLLALETFLKSGVLDWGIVPDETEKRLTRFITQEPNPALWRPLSRLSYAKDALRRNWRDIAHRPSLESSLDLTLPTVNSGFQEKVAQLRGGGALGPNIPDIRNHGMVSRPSASGIITRYRDFDDGQEVVSSILQYTEFPAASLADAVRNYMNLLSIHPFSDGNGRTARLFLIHDLRVLYDENAYAPINLLCRFAAPSFLHAMRLVSVGSPRWPQKIFEYFTALFDASAKMKFDLFENNKIYSS
ncbi:MAG: Fic family protein [Pseudomonadota bacterium]